jgi:uncharacterized protein (DUF1778 family)
MTKPPRKKAATKKTDSAKYNPNRQIGRVSDETWDLLKRAAEHEGLSFTRWALQILIREAKRILKIN